MARFFGTDGIRALAGQFPLDPPTLLSLGHALVTSGRRQIVIGRDTRESGFWIEEVLCRSITRAGGHVIAVGVFTTPGISFLTRTLKADAGVVISASHNPYQDNGIKIFGGGGLKLSDAEEEELESLLRQHLESLPATVSMDRSTREADFNTRENSAGKYVEFLKQIHERMSLDGIRVVLDCANGAAFRFAPRVFQELGAEVLPLNVHPNGRNINLHCGALHPEAMAEVVRSRKASFGVAFDGDADRSIFADETGTLLDGDHILNIIGRHLAKRGKMNSGTVVTTVMANIGLEIALSQAGLKIVRTQVGDRYVLEEMLRGDHLLGGEQSGHIILREHSPAGDGILTALTMAHIILQGQTPLSVLRRELVKYPQVLLNVRVREKKDFTRIPEIQASIDRAGDLLENEGRVVIRYSGTEPLARIMLEGKDPEQIRRLAESIAATFRDCLG